MALLLDQWFGKGKKGKPEKELTPEEIATLLQTTPEALKEFEAAYRIEALDTVSDNFFEVNARQAKEQMTRESRLPEALIFRIAQELMENTHQILEYDGEHLAVFVPEAESWLVEKEELAVFPEGDRPQLTGRYCCRDISEDSYPELLCLWKRYQETGNRMFYHQFRQGLDILDVDPVLYRMIGTNPNSMDFWFPALVRAVTGTRFFRIPQTIIAQIPETLLQMTRLEYSTLTPATLQVVDRYCQKVFRLDPKQEYFVKTGTYSSKFDFRNAHVHGAKEVAELGEYLLFIHYQALQMASPLAQPCIYGVSTTNEWVVREFIPDKEGNPCIYKGLPLHTEYRVFVDCDTDEVLGIVPYWDPETMKRRFGHSEDSDSPHQKHDYVIYQMHEQTLMERYHKHKERVAAEVEDVLPDLQLPGQWSIDIMQNGEDFWVIDMALAENSAFSDCIPEGKRRPLEENWIPKLQDKIREAK